MSPEKKKKKPILFFPQRPRRHQRAGWCDPQYGQRPLDFGDGNSKPWWLLQLSMHLCDGPPSEVCRAGPWNAHEAQSVPSRVTPPARGLHLDTCPAGDGPGQSPPCVESPWEPADFKGWGPSRELSVLEETSVAVTGPAH